MRLWSTIVAIQFFLFNAYGPFVHKHVRLGGIARLVSLELVANIIVSQLANVSWHTAV